MSEDARMWQYSRDKYYHRVAALENDFTQTLASNTQLQLAVFQIKAAELMIDKIMDDLQPEDSNDQ